MRVHNIYEDEQGISHFRDIEIDWVETVRASKRSEVFKVTGLVFRQNQGDYALGWHSAPRRQFIVNLDAGVRITTGDGEIRTIGAGEVILVEDTTGKGHISESIAESVRHSLIIHCE
jgi:hypothetical protein